MTPVLDLMQTVPVFAYLVPILFLFGFGAVAAMIATIIYAMPPMVRISTLALRQIPDQYKELGAMVGCTKFQMLSKVADSHGEAVFDGWGQSGHHVIPEHGHHCLNDRGGRVGL